MPTWSGACSRTLCPNPAPSRSLTGATSVAPAPDLAVIGNVGQFFQNPTVTANSIADIIARDRQVVHLCWFQRQLSGWSWAG